MQWGAENIWFFFFFFFLIIPLESDIIVHNFINLKSVKSEKLLLWRICPVAYSLLTSIFIFFIFQNMTFIRYNSEFHSVLNFTVIRTKYFSFEVKRIKLVPQSPAPRLAKLKKKCDFIKENFIPERTKCNEKKARSVQLQV